MSKEELVAIHEDTLGMAKVCIEQNEPVKADLYLKVAEQYLKLRYLEED